MAAKLGNRNLCTFDLFASIPTLKKHMPECTGREIMIEIMGHLGIVGQADAILASSNCIPCIMPFITSRFLPRAHGDLPRVVPTQSVSLGFIGPFCELPDDVVFTVEYSIRSAQAAVAELLDLNQTPPPVDKGVFDPRILFRAFVAHFCGARGVIGSYAEKRLDEQCHVVDRCVLIARSACQHCNDDVLQGQDACA
jgi:myosin-crossreactive antigen